MRKPALLLIAFVACASENNIRTVKNFRAARERGDDAAAQRYVSPDARIWFERKDGAGEPFGSGGGPWDHWDRYFHARTTLTGWREDGGRVTAVAHEMNDFMRLLDWQPAPYMVTYWLDDSGRIAQVLIKSLPGTTINRLAEFEEWAARNRPAELAYLMPNGKLDPTGDRPERWRRILQEWRGERPSRRSDRAPDHHIPWHRHFGLGDAPHPPFGHLLPAARGEGRRTLLNLAGRDALSPLTARSDSPRGARSADAAARPVSSRSSAAAARRACPRCA